MVQLRVRAVPLAGLLLMVVLFTPLPVESRPNPCPQGGVVTPNNLLNLVIPTVTACPPSFWAKTYGGQASDYAHSVDLTADGGFVVAGYTASFGAGDIDFWVIRLDVDGNIVWQKTYGGTGTDFPYSVRQTSDGGFIVAGGGTGSFGAGDLRLLRLDGNGNVVWQKIYGGINGEVAVSAEQISDGGFIVTGQTDSFGAGGFDFWVLRLNGSGDVIWQKAYGGASDEYPRSVHQTTDGGFFVAGHTRSFGAGASDFWLLRLDGNGSVVWQKTYGTASADDAVSAQQTFDGGFIVAGYTYPFGGTDSDMWILRLDGTGNVIWQKIYRRGSGGDPAVSVQQTPDGGFFVAGRTYSNSAGNDFLVLRLNANGSVVWQKSYGTSSGDERGEELRVTLDGGAIVVGGSASGGSGNFDFFVVRFDSNGNIPPNCALVKTPSVTTSNSVLVSTDSSAASSESTAALTATPVTEGSSSAKAGRKC